MLRKVLMRFSERDYNEEFRALVESDLEANRIGATTIRENLERSPLWYDGRLTVETLQVPKILTETTVADLKRIVRVAHAIFVKIIRAYLRDESLRRRFAFDPELEELILASTLENATSLLPMARFDVFYHEDSRDFYFCEVNTDGTSGMNDDRILRELFISNPAFQEFRRLHTLEHFELFDSWIATFMRLCSRRIPQKPRPGVAIVDFLDRATLREFEEFARRFQIARVDCEICDVRELRYENGTLLDRRGRSIDAVYRRAVTHDLMERRDEVRPFLGAVRDGAVFPVGGLCTQIVHSKRFFYALHTEEARRALTSEEIAFVEEHFPLTTPFHPDFCDLDEVLRNKDRYILKPTDLYASKGVFAGVENDESGWEQKARAVYGADYICQRFCPLYQTPNVDFVGGDGEWSGYTNMLGLFVYDGEFAGVLSRQAQGNAVIASFRNERTIPTYFIRENDDET